MAKTSIKNASIIGNVAHAFVTLAMLQVTTLMDETAEDARALLMVALRALRDAFKARPASYHEEVIRIFGSGRVEKGEEKVEGLAPAEYRAQLEAELDTLAEESGEAVPAEVIRSARNCVNDYVSKARAIAKAAADPAFNLDVTFWEAYQNAPKEKGSNRSGKGKRKAAEVKGMSVREFATFVKQQAEVDDAHFFALLETAAKILETARKRSINAEAIRAIARDIKAA